MNRRTFIRRSALATAGAAALSQLHAPRAQAGEFTGRIRKALKFHMVTGKLSVGDKFKLIKDLGYHGTELRAGDKADRREVSKAIETTGIPVHGVVNSSNPDIASAIDLAKHWGGTSVLVVARYNRKIPLMQNWRETQDVIRRAIPHAEKQEIKILVENVWASFLISPFDMQRYIDELDSPWVGVYFDVGNNMRWGVPSHWIPILGHRIGKLDIKEYSTQLQRSEGLAKGFSAPLGEGSIDWANVRKELKAIDYTGWATAEIKGGDREWLKDISQRMDKVLDLA